ncbi:hypothetical protein MPTK1_3g13860 [Marchantia polymorpha subsp. ruderalis]|uniref:Uncharacterized protein n=2 Tax=Marchantia polymorpha TaxID=3197 RepID=A0AAF6B0J0_MARPO|nr:hypothetical protein MARPO_0004s0285 [Marchantia polymorpha]BBN05524.1 hypothetical protein Mp_3g13860 [Marchantia polymorpha subsp. ruderalis]|eukprot:PTQ49056.1 hypothetical protein MARPO_0004s0285 [Marchantia polymorpha]
MCPGSSSSSLCLCLCSSRTQENFTVPGAAAGEMAGEAFGAVMRLENLLRMGMFWTLAVIYSYAQLLHQKLFRSGIIFSRSPRIAPDGARLVCIVTGASSGIGRATAEALAVHGYHVILAGRARTRLLEVVWAIRRKHDNVSLEALELDLCSVGSILSFVDQVKSMLQASQGSKALQLLVNNAGILAGSSRCTETGSDSMITSNYLGPYLLTQHLLPHFHQGHPRARIVNVTSFTHRCVRAGIVDEKQLARGSLANFPLHKSWYSLAQVYENSKFCLLLFTYELHRRFHDGTDSFKLSVMAADPGIVRTNIMRELPSSLVSFTYFVLSILRLLQDPSDGSKAVLDAALAPEDVSGEYFFGGNGRTVRSSALSYDKVLAKQIWRLSNSICQRAMENEEQ